MCEAVPPQSHTPAWCGAPLRTGITYFFLSHIHSMYDKILQW